LHDLSERLGTVEKTDAGGEASTASTAPVAAPLGMMHVLRNAVLGLAMAVVAWWLTYRLLTLGSNASTDWLAWGMQESFVPAVTGLPKAASMIAGFVGVVWFALPVLIVVRRVVRGGASQASGQETPEIDKGGS
jgi:hypothetical protein